MNEMPRVSGSAIETGDAFEIVPSLAPKAFNLIVTSPPYNIGKIYEKSGSQDFDGYLTRLDLLIGHLIDKLADNGSICWQVGNYVRDGEIYPLDVYFYQSFKKRGMQLRNRIVWQFNFGLHSKRRFSGRYETILWFTKSRDYKFNLDPVRIPQLYPGKRHSSSKGHRAGRLSGNPSGKNPSDYWEFSASDHFFGDIVWKIPNIKANHPEKTKHPCQFPIELVERCVLALTDENDVVFDPFAGTGASLLAAVKNKRIAIGIEKEPEYSAIANARLLSLASGTLVSRPLSKPVLTPLANQKVAQIPNEWIGGSRGQER